MSCDGEHTRRLFIVLGTGNQACSNAYRNQGLTVNVRQELQRWFVRRCRHLAHTYIKGILPRNDEQFSTMSAPTSVVATIPFYLPPKNGERAYININADSTTGERVKNYSFSPQAIEIENIRGKEGYSLDVTGFQLLQQPSSHKDFSDDKAIEREYYPESIDLIKGVTDASRVVIFDHSMCHRLEVCRSL